VLIEGDVEAQVLDE